MLAGLRHTVVAGLCALLCGTAMADVYTYIDAQGNRVFTDQPRANAKRVQVSPGNQMAAPPRTEQRKPPTPPTKPLFSYDLLRILVPEPDASVRDGQSDLVVSVTSEPKLQDGHLYRLLLDGQPYGEARRSPVFALHNIDRGQHSLSVEIIDEQGLVVERTPKQLFHMLRISLAQKRLVRPCKKDDYGVRPECPIEDKPEDDD